MTTCRTCLAVVPPGRFCAGCGSLLAPTANSVVSAPVVYVPQQPQSPAPAYVPAQQPSATPPSCGPAMTIIAAQPPHPHPQQLAPLPYAGTGRSRRSDPRTTGATVVTVAALVVGAFVLFGQPPHHHLTGDLSLSVASDLAVGATCDGSGGYSDIAGGTQVVLEDGSGSTLATTTLSDGAYDGTSCVFHFDLLNVPKKAFYALRMGNASRGDQRYSYSDMVSRHWATHLDLGS